MKKLEICCYSADDAILAQQGGADRIELCSGRSDGGLTPSLGELMQAKSEVQLPIHPIVRPRGGDFCYSQRELHTMKNDIDCINDLGLHGIVIGMLTPEGDIDIEALYNLTKNIGSLSITFHRAFDMCRDPFLALEQLTDLGIERILTSGQQPTAKQGLPLILTLCDLSKGPIIMPGCGIRPENIQDFNSPLIKEIHSSASRAIPSSMKYRNDSVSMGQDRRDEYVLFETDITAVQSMKKHLVMS